MPTITLAEAQTRLTELIEKLLPGEELFITQDDQPVAKLARVLTPGAPREPGSAVGELFIVKEDEEHLQDFREYMP